MHISPVQSFVQRQSVIVTPQLQQAIRLLQMGNAELQAFIETQAEENPFIELRPASTPLPDLPFSRMRGGDDNDWDRIAALPDERAPSLYAHVESQVEKLGLPPCMAYIASAYLDALEPSGWLGQSVAEVAAAAGVTVAEALDVLPHLQAIEPAGLFARDLSECLRLQAQAMGVLDPLMEAVLDHLPLVASANMAALARTCGCSAEDLRPVLRLLRTFNPKPGAQFGDDRVPQMPPDLIVTQGAEGWTVDLNRSTLPGISVRRNRTLAMPFGPGASHYLSERLSIARWLARAVQHRNETSLRIGAEIIRRQQGFLDHGPSQMAPLTLREVADAVGVHESTVSRVCAGMMIATPQGTFPLKHFFPASLAKADGAQTGSSEAARHLIRQIIRAEPKSKPLSDDEIARRVTEEGIQLARRTVAKYREMMHIPTASDRRRQAALAAQVA